MRTGGIADNWQMPRQVVKVWAYTVEGRLPSVVRRVEAALRTYTQEYLGRCGLFSYDLVTQHGAGQ